MRNRQGKQRFLTSTMLAGAAFALAMPAMAQDAAEEDSDFVMEEIITTAQKREESILDVPVSVSIVSGDQIAAQGNLVDIQSIQALIPSLQIRRGSGNRESTLIMRGVGTISFSIGAEPAVAAVLDGVTFSRAGQAFNELADIERIEVLKGPQGTLFGKNASAGVVNIVSKGPTKEFEASAEFSYFEDDEIRVRGAISGPISDTLRYRVNTFFGNFDGFLENRFNGTDAQGYDRAGIRGQLEWDAADNVTVKVIADWMSRDDNCCADVLDVPTNTPFDAFNLGGVTEGINTRFINQDHPARNTGDAFGFQTNVDWAMENGHDLQSITAFREWNDTLSFDLDFGPNSFERGPAFVSNGFFGNGIVDTGITRVRQYSQEFRLNSPTDQKLTYTLGAFYFRSQTDRSFTRDTNNCTASTLAVDPVTGAVPCAPGASSFDILSATAVFDVTVDNIAAFGNATYEVNDRLRLLAGARWTRDEIDYNFNRTSTLDGTQRLADLFAAAGADPTTDVIGIGPGLRSGISRSDSTNDDDLTIRAGVQYDITDDIMAYATYTEGYKGPAFNVFFNFSPGNAAPIGSETAESWEAGLKTQLFDGRMILNMAAYSTEYQNFQANNFVIIGGVATTSLTNAGNVKTEGFEIDFLAQPTDNLSITGGLAYTDARVSEFFLPEANPTPERIAQAAATEGTRLPFAPEWALNIAAEYVWPMDKFDVVFNTQFNWQDDQLSNIFQTDPENSIFRIDSYGIWNAGLTVRSKDEKYSATFHVRNIGDEQYITTVSGGFGPGRRIQVPRDAQRYIGFTFRVGM